MSIHERSANALAYVEKCSRRRQRQSARRQRRLKRLSRNLLAVSTVALILSVTAVFVSSASADTARTQAVDADRIHSRSAVVSGLDGASDTVSMTDSVGCVWVFEGVEDWCIGDVVAFTLLDTAGTPDSIWDDEVVSWGYSGWTLDGGQLAEYFEGVYQCMSFDMSGVILRSF